MYSGDECFESMPSLNGVENYNSFSKFSQIQAEYKSKDNENCPNFPDNKGDSAVKSAVTWNEEYSERLASFMKHSKSLLENIDKKQNLVKQEINTKILSNENNIIVSKSPTHTLIELEEKLLQLDDQKYKFDWETDIEKSTKISSEALLIDELETQLIVLRKQLDEKERKMKLLQSELQIGKENKEKPNKTIYHNLFTEFSNKYYPNTNIEENEKIDSTISRDQQKNGHSITDELTNEKIFDHHDDLDISNIKAINKTVHNDQQNDIVESLSIKDYNPNNPIALQNKIKDLESQIQDLQEANEIASHFVSTVRDNRTNESYINSNSAISELIVRNQTLREEVEKLRQNVPVLNGDSLSSRFLRNELVNLKEDLFILKQQNNMIVIENKKLKNIIKKSGILSDSEINDKESSQKDIKKYGRKIIKRANHQIRQDNDCIQDKNYIENEYEKRFSEHKKQINGDNCLYDTNNMEFSNDSTDSILNDVNKIDDYQLYSSNFRNQPNSKESMGNGFQNKLSNLNLDSYEFPESKEFPTLAKNHVEANESYNVNKFSTLGRIAFAPRSGSDINIYDVVKFIRQGGRISKGLVHFIGHLPKRNDIYLGIELEIEDGKHDGIYEGKRYFQCRQYKGVFVAFNKIIMVYSNK